MQELTGWKKTLLRSIGVGAGFALALVALFGGLYWWSERPKPWRSDTIVASAPEVTVSTAPREDQLHIRFRYPLKNNTKDDYQLPMSGSTGVLMRQLPDGGSLVKFNDVKWDDSLRIPPGQTMNETFDVSITLADYNTNSALLANDSGLMMGENLSKFVGVRLKEMDGLVFFDYANHYKIMLPKNWETGKN